MCPLGTEITSAAYRANSDASIRSKNRGCQRDFFRFFRLAYSARALLAPTRLLAGSQLGSGHLAHRTSYSMLSPVPRCRRMVSTSYCTSIRSSSLPEVHSGKRDTTTPSPEAYASCPPSRVHRFILRRSRALLIAVTGGYSAHVCGGGRGGGSHSRRSSAIRYEISPNSAAISSFASAQWRYPVIGTCRSSSAGRPGGAYRATAPTRQKPKRS
mmetsp:Transcript_25048/g.60525  ORF Transcript_25048/g.60525 Transcript_25048/m.60525 type:complete len:213 (-) Transcript_25048:160-798(-)